MISYFHNRKHRGHQLDATVAIDLCSKEFLQRMFESHSTQTMLNLGLAIKSEEDEFIKKTGRETSLKHLQLMPVLLTSVDILGTKHVYIFKTKLEHNRNKYQLKFAVTTIAENDEVRLIDAVVNDD